jgi:aminoglycoside phosphotransferase (APT) family kinase protein
MSDQSQEYFERLVDVDALEAFLEDELGPADHYEVERHNEGHSNETLFAEWGDTNLVIRRPPPGETADTAHDVLREFAFIDALQDTDVPVARTVASSDDHSIIGSDFYIMERVEGTVLRDHEPEDFANPEDRKGVGTELVDTLAKIHDIDTEAVGLDDFGHPPGYTERQVERWGKQLDWAFEVTKEDREVPKLEEVGEWLQDNYPTEHPHTLVHGDYKLDNVMFGPERPVELAAVFDWEMATRGDPKADLGWMLSYWRDAKDPDPQFEELVTDFMAHEDYPTRRDLVSRWEDHTGFTYTEEEDRFYRTLSVYKLAGLGEMFYRRYLEGNSDDPMYPKMEERVPRLADRAMRIIEGEEPL